MTSLAFRLEPYVTDCPDMTLLCMNILNYLYVLSQLNIACQYGVILKDRAREKVSYSVYKSEDSETTVAHANHSIPLRMLILVFHFRTSSV